jgi:TusE/DsrC/DsvC family sulfur relay protein
MSARSGQGSIVLDGELIELDEDGHLRRSGQWRPAVAEALAQRDGLILGPDHWWLIEFVRQHHHQYGTPPLMRVVVSAMRAHHEDASLSSRAVYHLFSENPVRTACRYGGLPKPDWCI